MGSPVTVRFHAEIFYDFYDRENQLLEPELA